MDSDFEKSPQAYWLRGFGTGVLTVFVSEIIVGILVYFLL